MNKRKKIRIVSAAIGVAAIIIVSAIILAYKNEANNSLEKTGSKNETEGTITQFSCNYENDDAAYKDAIEVINVEICDCIKNEKLNSTCKEVVFEQSIYNQALAQANPELCNQIENLEIKDACKNVAQSKIDYLAKEDNQALVDIYRLSHNVEGSIEELEKLVKEDSNNLDNVLDLALSYAEKGLKEQEQGNSQTEYVKKALDTIVQAKQINQNSSKVYRVEGYIYEIQPDIQKAIASYSKAIELNKKNTEAYAGRGHANRILGTLDKAIDDFNEAAKLNKDSNNIFIYTNLCTLYKSKGDTGEALKNCKIVINSNDVDPVFKSEAYQVLGNIYTETKEYKLATSQFLQAKILTPNSASLYIELSRLNIFQGQYELAEQNARKAQALAPKKAYANLALAHALYMQEKYEEAIKVAEEGIKLVDGDVSLLMSDKSSTKKDLYYSMANCYRELGDAQNQKKYELLAEDAK